MSRQDIAVAIARHQQFIDRATTMIDADASGGEIPEAAEFHQQELESLDSSTARLMRETLGRPAADDEWQAPGRYASIHQPTGDQWEKMGWVKTYRGALRASKNFLDALLSVSSAP
jgi:hypothetical protein